ncbi:MAG: EAL domain-containing protein [Oscillospiraceae bacterium]|nr:EAL domain-containing protein [Oscillospiraceae bacterium]
MKGNKKTTGRKHPLFIKMSAMMALLAFLQLLTFVVMMFAGGVLTQTRRYAYNMLAEKTRNRAAYIENFLNQRVMYVDSSASEVNDIIENILKDEGKEPSAIKTDKELNKRIIEETSESIVSLLRRSGVNDAFIYLNTGELYMTEDTNKLTGFYVRDTDTYSTVQDNGDLLLEAGNADVARRLDITMDFEWSLYTSMSPDNDFSFFEIPIEAFESKESLNAKSCGYWSGFSRISRSASASMKYTMPLTAKDGTVYGVIGIGLLEKSIMSSIPTNDFLNESACYIIGADTNNDSLYGKEVYSGAAYARLVSEDTVFDKTALNEDGMNFYNTKSPTVGSIVDMNLYSAGSAFRQHRWALISVADSEAILEIYHKSVSAFIISSVISLIIGVAVSIILSRMVTKPVSDMTGQLEKNSGSGDIVSFVESGIYEFDMLANSIVELQLNVREHASRVSHILSISESGIGTFMYDYRNDSVFIGKSLLKILDFNGVEADEDFTIPFAKFREYLHYFDEKYKIFDNEIFSTDSAKTGGINIDTKYMPDGNSDPKWFRFSFTKDENAVMGLVQDVTMDVLKRRQIEHERDYDVTTDIYNRRAFYRKVSHLFSSPEKLGVAAFVMMDLDNLKFVNDTFGHEYGDRYIRAAADALRTLNNKNGVVARLSGDEFIAFIYGGKNKDNIRKVIEEFKETLQNSSCTLADGSGYKVRASGGISWYPDNSDSYEQLIKYADFSMYTIKHSTKGCFAEFNKNSYMNDSILITGIQEMNRIIDKGDVRFAFQPIIAVKTGKIFGYEALMCPQSESIGTVTELLRIAKSSAKLYEIERLTFFLGIASFSRLVEDKKVSADAHLFLNSISECILDERAFSGIEANYKPILKNIVLENLDVDRHNSEFIAKKQKIVSEWGGMTALDNFGTGHNNETAMFNTSPDMIIVDRTIIEGCSKDTGKTTIIKNLVQLTRERGILVVAQGIETDDDLREIISLGVDLVQGYCIAEPELEPKGISEEIAAKIAEYAKNSDNIKSD